MFTTKDLLFSEEERALNINLNRVFARLYDYLKGHSFVKQYTENDLVFDGIFPGYLRQSKKILFIGREAIGINGQNYIECLYDAYKFNSIGEKTLDSSSFHNRMYYITYGIENNFPDWESLSYASKMAEKFGLRDGISFAFMNLSKFSNESGNWNVDWELVDSFLNSIKNTKFLFEEISIINPDLIITMNLQDRLKNLGDIKEIEYGEKICVYSLKVNNRDIYIFDTYHFSSTKNSSEDFYSPIKDKCIKYKILT